MTSCTGDHVHVTAWFVRIILFTLLQPTTAQQKGGLNVCEYRAQELHSHRTSAPSGAFGWGRGYKTAYRQVEVTKYKCCDDWYPGPNGDDCSIPICFGRRGSHAGTCLNEGICLSPGTCQCPQTDGLDKDDCSDIDECALSTHACSHECENTPGSYQCKCPTGYHLENGTTCQDNNECHQNNDGCDQICNNIPGLFKCSCRPGYSNDWNFIMHYFFSHKATCQPICFGIQPAGNCLNGQECVAPDKCACADGLSPPDCADIDECAYSPPVCSHDCENTVGSYTCSCPTGYSLVNGTTCQAVCFGRPPGSCPNGGTCTEPDECTCPSGYHLPSCQDIDECAISTHACSHECENTPGSYQCKCPAGYHLENGTTCQDIDECDVASDAQPLCEKNCVNTVGSFLCECESGLREDKNGNCKNFNECEVAEGEEPPCDQLCVNTAGSFDCTLCADGFWEDNDGECHDINECDVVIGGSPRCKESCVNTQGSFRCECDEGFRDAGNGTCVDVDECETDELCEQQCVNNKGSYACECFGGYNLENGSCKDINECDVVTGGSPRCEQSCVNTQGSFRCECDEGFRDAGNGSCLDVDECETTELCEEKCVKNEGSFTCECYEGYNLENGSCKDVDECETTELCEQICVNNKGSYTCECFEGYVLENGSCRESNSCDTNNGGCSHKCVTKEGAYECSCPKGHGLVNETTCADIDECENGQLCEQKCLNNEGSYRCECYEGYVLNNGSCKDIDECQSVVCATECQNTQGSYECRCEENYVTNLEGECIEVILCGPGDDPRAKGCAPLCEGSPDCSCPEGLKLHIDKKHCIDPCIISPCQHDGQCLASSVSGYRCECKGTGYTGDHCELGVIHMSSRLTVRVGETLTDIRIDARPEKELLLMLSNHIDAVTVIPSLVRVSGPTQFSMLVSKRGVYDLIFNVTGSSAGAFEETKRLQVRAEDVFSRLELQDGLLPVGCFWYLLKFQHYEIWFVSTSPWYKQDSVVFTIGIVMLVHDSLQLPMSTNGLEIATDQEITLRHGVSKGASPTILQTNVSCDTLVLSDRDMQDFYQSQSTFKSLFANVGRLIPFNMQLSLNLDTKINTNISFEPQILSAHALQKHSKCRGAPALDGRLYVTFELKQAFLLKIQEETIEMEKDDLCMIVNMHVEGGYTVTFMFSDQAASKLTQILPVNVLQARTRLLFTINGLSVSLPGHIYQPARDKDVILWNGNAMISHRKDENATLWIKAVVTNEIPVKTNPFNFKISAATQLFLTNKDVDGFLTNLFAEPEDLLFRLDNASIELAIMVFGERHVLGMIQGLHSNRYGVLAIGKGGATASTCETAGYRDGVYMMTTVNATLLKDTPVISNFIIGKDDEKLFFKTYTRGLENKTNDFFWDKYTKQLLTKLQNTAMSILGIAGSQTLAKVTSPTVVSLFGRMTEEATDLSTRIIDMMKAEIHVDGFAKFSQAVSKHVRELKNTYLDAKNFLSVQLDNTLDDLFEDLALLVEELKELIKELLMLLYDITIPISPDMGTWGLKGAFGVTVLDMFLEFKGEIISSDEAETTCLSRYSDFYAYLGEDKTLRVLGQVSSWNLNADAVGWGRTLWTYFTPENESRLEIAFSTKRTAFVSRLQVNLNLLGLNATTDLFISTEGIRSSAKGNMWEIFPGRLTVGAEYTTQPKDWNVWISGEFLGHDDDTFNTRLMEHISKAVRIIGENAKRRLDASEKFLSSAKQTVVSAKKNVESASKNVAGAEDALNAAIARLDAARKTLEKTKEQGLHSDGVLIRICDLKQCESICTRRLTWGRYCQLWWSVQFPCFKPTLCAARVLDLKCVAANAVCRMKRSEVYGYPQFAIPASSVNVAKAEARVTAAGIYVNASRDLLQFYRNNLEGAKSGLTVAEGKANESASSLENLKISLLAGAEILHALTDGTLYRFIEIGNCSFNISLFTATDRQLDVHCELNFMIKGWVERGFVLDLENIAGSLWRVGNGLVTEVLEQVRGRRKRRNIESSDSFALDLHRRDEHAENSNHVVGKLTDAAAGFWKTQCLAYAPNIEFIRRSLEFLHNITYRVTEEASVAQQDVTAYFEEFDVEFVLNKTKYSQTHSVPPEYDMLQDELDHFIKNLNVADDPVTNALASFLSDLEMIQQHIIQAYINNKVIVLWRTEMQPYTKRTFAVDHDCFGFTDCILFALGQVKSVMNSVEYSLVKEYAVSFSRFEQGMYSLIEEDARGTTEIARRTVQLLEEFITADASEIFCGTMPRIRSHPANATLVERENVTFVCEVDAVPSPSFAWYKNNVLIPDANQESLTLLKITTIHEGYYRCVAENHIGQAASNEAFVNVLFPPKFEENLPESLTLFRGDDLSLSCSVPADPAADILWYSTGSVRSVSSGKTLVLDYLPDNTAVLYKCVANNTYGMAESSEVAVYVTSKTPACPSVKLQVKFSTRAMSDGEIVLLPLTPTSTSLARIFETAFFTFMNGTFSQVRINVTKVHESQELVDIMIGYICTNFTAWSNRSCEFQYRIMSNDMNDTVNHLLELADKKLALFVKENNVVYLLSGKTKLHEVESSCPTGHTKFSDNSCVSFNKLLLDPPSDLQLKIENGKIILRWSPPGYAESFAKGYQVTLRNKVDGKTVTFNVSGSESFLVLDGSFHSENYEVTLSAYTASHKSEEVGLTVDMARMNSQLEAHRESGNNTGVLIGVSVAICCLLVAAGILVRRYLLSKKKHSASVSSLVSVSSTDDFHKSAWMPIIAEDKFKTSKRHSDRI